MNITKEQKENLTVAKINITMIEGLELFSSILFSTPVVYSEEIKTLATNGLWIKVNPTFFSSLSVDTRIAALVHEVSHITLKHAVRVGKKTL